VPPDQKVPLDLPPGPERLLKSLFLQWNPAGRTRSREKVSEEMLTDWIEGMLKGEHSFVEREAFYYQAWPLGWRLIGLLRRFKVQVEILDDDVFVSRYGTKRAGHYIYRFKLIHIKRSCLFDTRGSVVIHELGHAIDHLISSLANGGHSVSSNLWQWFRPQRTGFVTKYASTKPEEYLAESVEAYFIREDYLLLRRLDPAMYVFLDDLFIVSAS
jgi:Mlc titration factor MtfA (ptsG expression regulator)